MPDEFSWKVGGQSGEGIDSTGDIFARALNNLGYYTYAFRHFPSRIRGGHTNYKIRIKPTKVHSGGNVLDMLIAFDQDSIDKNEHELVPGGAIVYDSSSYDGSSSRDDVELYGVPLTEMAKEAGMAIMKNIVAVGVTASLLGLDSSVFEDEIRDRFGSKGEKIVQGNITALTSGYDYCQEEFGAVQSLPERQTTERHLALTGNEALAFGAYAGGCRFLAAYPITPATDIMMWLIPRLPKKGGVVLQAEDEIAAINMAIGASYAGVRSMTSTSGPGFSLMQEAVGLTGMAELPLVIVDVQRTGPSTGMPTKVEQSDLNLMAMGSHGEIPRIVIAPTSIQDCFEIAVRAFNLADEFQCPVFIASDLAIGMSKQSIDGLSYEAISVDRGQTLTGDALEEVAVGEYQRFAITGSGVSPRALPGTANGRYVARGLEHDEFGHRSEDAGMREEQMNKRFRKLDSYDPSDWGIVYEGPEEPDLMFLAFGSPNGPVQEAVEELQAAGHSVGQLKLRALLPLPGSLADYLQRAKHVVVAEHNYTGQLAGLIRRDLGFHDRLQSLLKYDGTPFLPEEIIDKAEEVL